MKLAKLLAPRRPSALLLPVLALLLCVSLLPLRALAVDPSAAPADEAPVLGAALDSPEDAAEEQPETPEDAASEQAAALPAYTPWIVSGAVVLTLLGVALFVLKTRRKGPADPE